MYCCSIQHKQDLNQLYWNRTRNEAPCLGGGGEYDMGKKFRFKSSLLDYIQGQGARNPGFA